MIFTAENWLPDSFFDSTERSIYLGKNHLDAQRIDRADNSYDWVSSNHVLEHVENDISALKEMYRVLTDRGTLQLTVPTPGFTYQTRDWGFADKSKFGHYRNYGADFILALKRTLPEAYVLSVIIVDSMTDYTDICYLVSKSRSRMDSIAKTLTNAGYLVVPDVPRQNQR